MELKLTDYEKLSSKLVFLLVTLTFLLSGALYWMKQLFINKVNFIKNGCFYPHEHFAIVSRIKNVI